MFHVGWVVVLLVLIAGTDARGVSGISRCTVGRNGGLRITIHGNGFAKEQFSLDDPSKGNKAVFYSATAEYECDVLKEDSTETQITCYTKPMPIGEYQLKVAVDAETIPKTSIKTCTLAVKDWITPTMTRVQNRTAEPGSIITIEGRIFTDKYGSNIAQATNGRTAKILRVYVGGSKCALKDNTTETYGLGLYQLQDGRISDYGYIKCRMEGTYVGNMNVSFIIDDYGRSYPDLDIRHQSAGNKIYMIQTYAVIEGITPTEGSMNGGTNITITGRNFDETDASAIVRVGEMECSSVTYHSSSKLTCITPPKPAVTGGKQPGGRGVTLEKWRHTAITDLGGIVDLRNDASDYEKTTQEYMTYEDRSSNDDYPVKLSSFYRAQETGPHRVTVKGAGGTQVYINGTGTQIDQNTPAVRCLYTCNNYNNKVSEDFSFTKGQMVYMVMVCRHTNNESHCGVKVTRDISSQLGQSTGEVKQEVKRVHVSSEETLNVQKLKLMSAFGQNSFTATVVNLHLRNIDPTEKFKLTLFGYSSDWIVSTAAAKEIQTALNKMPLMEEKISVTEKTSNAGNAQFDITFNLDMGNIPFTSIQAQTDSNNGQLSASVSQSITGVAGLGHLNLQLKENYLAPPIAAPITAQKIETALKTAIGAICPRDFYVQDAARIQNDFESAQDVTCGNTLDTTVEAFCGRSSLKNPNCIFKRSTRQAFSVDLKMCFAYKGNMSDNFKSVCLESNNSNRTVVSPTNLASTESWNYTCVTLSDLVPEDCTRVVSVEFYGNQGDRWIDVAMVTENIDFYRNGPDHMMEQIRKQPRLGSGEGQLIGDVRVEEEDDAFLITISPQECGYDIPQIKPYGSQADADGYFPVGPNGLVECTTITPSNPPVTGSVTLAFMGKSITVPADSSAEQIQQAFQDKGEFVSVVHSGNCSDFRWDITWTKRMGNQPEMTLETNRLVGNGVSITLETTVNGSTSQEVGGDLASTVHSGIQVTGLINNIPTACDQDCSYTYSEAVTPVINQISPLQGPPGTDLTLTGTGFTFTPTVRTGEVLCNLTSYTTTTIQCSVGNGPSGPADVVVHIGGIGFASTETSDRFTITAGVESHSPTSGSLGGGTHLTISGWGFAADATVTVGVNPCELIGPIAPRQIVCITPSSDTATSVAVSVNTNNEVLTSGQFTYDQSLTAQLNSVSPSSSGVTGGEEFTIVGAGFGVSPSVLVGEMPATIIEATDTSITGVFPAQGVGDYPFSVRVANRGYATVGSAVSDARYTLALNGISPDHGSLYGGTMVTGVGQGFGIDASALEVTIGSTPCDVISVTDNHFICQIQKRFQTFNVDNTGLSSIYGSGFAWNYPDLQVQVGDEVVFSWTGNTDDTMLKISEIDGPNGVKLNEGWDSGDPLHTGSYRIKIPESGQYWYRSTDDGEKVFEGKITAKEKQSTKVDIMVKVNNFEATYNTQSGATVPADSGSCGKVTSPKTGCSVGTPSGGSTDKFNYVYTECYSGEVTGMASDKDMVTLTGSGWSNTLCQNNIVVGNHPCIVQSVTASEVRCQINTTSSTEMQTSVKHEVSVIVAGHGASLLKLKDPTYVLQPFVRQISPVLVSSEGGATLTASGAGLSDAYVMINGYPREGIRRSYTEIVFSVPAGHVGSPVALEVRTNVGDYLIPCESCEYYYTDNLQVTSVAPITVDGSVRTTFTINGLGFQVTDNSALAVKFGSNDCENPQVLSSNKIECEMQYLSLGQHPVNVTVSDLGTAISASSATVEGIAMLNSVSPTQGSENGNTSITLSGNGFMVDNTSITIGGIPCDISTTSLSTVTCWTRSGSGPQAISVSVMGIAYAQQLDYEFASSRTPTITAVDPTSGTIGTKITVTGSGFSTNDGENMVNVGEAECTVISQSATEIVCTSGTHPAEVVPVTVYRSGFGKAAGDVSFTYALTPSTIEPNSGALSGGQKVSIKGQGFDPSTSVTFCGQAASLVPDETTSSRLVLETPSYTGTETVSCDVLITSGTQSAILTYTYVADRTAEILHVSPRHGGTAGGTLVTISGTGFGTGPDDVSGVSIGGVSCAVQSVTETEVTCITGQRQGSISTVVDLTTTWGRAKQINAGFNYYDVWSSEFSWNGNGRPVEGDFVVIPEGQTILLDETTPILKMLLIKGGTVIFDEKDIELKAEYILITKNGTLQIGTEDEPFQSKAIITLVGHSLSQELPIYGAKVLAVRYGRLELHGIPRERTWTVLDRTAEKGETTLLLQQSIDAKVGDEIVVATTGHRHSQGETEVRTVTAVSADGLTLTLSEPLEHQHLGVTSTIGSRQLEARAEVGLLTRNIVVRGSSDKSWAEKIEACEEGFDTGEFATQTCFQGRFGEEIGSDQYGGQVMMHSENATGKIEQAEFKYVGQAFRLGRYPIHFHLLGYQEGSYVRGVAIHQSFNRALNIHGTHNVLVEKNVAYNIMGGAFFLEDGVETGNRYYNNLALFVKASSSLLNDDITPAAFWATNPNNTYVGNTAAGGTHFGWWYRLLEHVEGPSSSSGSSITPWNLPYGQNSNNTAHSLGWFGLWIFEFSFPHKNGDPNGPPEPAYFYNIVVWNCEKGIEFVIMGSYLIENALLVNNEFAGFEGKFLKGDKEGSMHQLRNSVIAGWAEGIPPVESKEGLVTSGVVLSYGSIMEVESTSFYNYDQFPLVAFSFTSIQGTCINNCGGFNYYFNNIYFRNSARRVLFRWQHEGVLYDLDGSITGTPGNKILPDSGILPSSCIPAPDEYNIGDVNAVICPPWMEFGAISFNNVQPDSTFGTNAILGNTFGNAVMFYEFHRLLNPQGWMGMLPVNGTTNVSFENAPQLTNISYDANFLSVKDNTYMIFCHRLTNKPDMFFYYAGMGMEDVWSESTEPLHINTDKKVDGDWYFNEAEKEFCYLVSGVKNNSRPVRAKGTTVVASINAFKCELEGCVYKDPNSTPRKCSSTNAVKWSTYEWGTVSEENCRTWDTVTQTCKAPVDGDSVFIPSDVWMVLDESPPILNELIIYGTLEVQQGAMGIRITAYYIYIFKGQLLIGCDKDNYFSGSVTISLRGNHSTPDFATPHDHQAPNIGSKAIAVFGVLMLNGRPISKTWTTMRASANASSNILKLNTTVDWQEGDEVIISATGYNPYESEYQTIKDIRRESDEFGQDYSVLTLERELTYSHNYSHEDFGNGKWYTMTAEVGLLTRNIRVEGEIYVNQQKEEFGGRILVSAVDADGEYIAGSALISYTQFDRMGQFGFTSPYDGRQGVVFKSITDAASDIKPSYVVGCSFKESYSSSIVARDTDNLLIEGNVLSGSVGPGILSDATGTKVFRNMVSGFKFPGTFNGRYEASNSEVGAALELTGEDAEVSWNAISGSERACWTGLPEPEVKSVPDWSDNICHSSLFGLVLFPNSFTTWPKAPVKISNFTIYKTSLYGIYFNTPLSVKFSNLKFIDNIIGVFPFCFEPSALDHKFDLEKYIKIENSLFVGHSKGFNCETDVINTTVPYYRVSVEGTAPGITNERVGAFMGSCTGGPNNSPLKPLNGIMDYQTIALISELTGCSFVHWRENRCPNEKTYAVASPPSNDDYTHPLRCSKNQFDDVDENSRLGIKDSTVGKINPSDCVDMECDGYRFIMVYDEDGTFSGRGIPTELHSIEFNYNGDPRYGVGDSRIPTPMLTSPDGSKIEPSTLHQYQGITRSGSCERNEISRYWNCTGRNNELVMLESMDSDTETRRLSPVAVHSRNSNGDWFMNQINGPQDHGWCSGYTCRKRLSLFPLILDKNAENTVYFTSTSPQHLRIHMPTSDPSKRVKLSVYYTFTNSLDVYFKDSLIDAKNKKVENGKTVYQYPSEHPPGYFSPDLENDVCGSNFLDGSMMELIACGQGWVDVKMKEAIVVGCSIMTLDDFFGENIVSNLATFLGIDDSKIRIVDVRKDVAGRKKRSVGTTTYYLEISESSCSHVNCTGQATAMTYTDLLTIASDILNAFQNGILSTTMNITINGLSITEAVPPIDDAHWQTFVDSPASERLVQVLDSFTFYNTITTDAEGNVFAQQPKLHFTDSTGAHVKYLGVAAIPWKVQAVLRSGTGSNILTTLAGNTTVDFVDGWANFSDLSLSHSGSGFIIDFNIIFPESNFTLESEPLVVPLRPFKVDLAYSAGNAYTGNAHELRLKVVDTATNTKVDNLVWNGGVWSAVVTPSSTSGYSGTLSGTTAATFNPSTSEVTFNDLIFDSVGVQVFTIIVTSTTGYNLTMEKEVIIMNSALQSMVPDVTQSLTVTYDIDFNVYGNLHFAAGAFLNIMMARHPLIAFSDLTVTQGSVVISVTISGNMTTVTEVLDSVCSNISSGSTFTYNSATFVLSSTMTVDGQQYYGVNCEKKLQEADDSDDTNIGLIIGLVIAIVAVIVLIGIIVFWKLKVVPKTKTHKITTKEDEVKYMGTHSPIEDILWREQSFMSIREKGLPDRPMPGMSTQLGGRTTPMY